MSSESEGAAPAPSRPGPPSPSDFLGLDAQLTEDERALRDSTRAFVEARILPGISEWYERGEFPVHLAKEIGDLGLLGMHLSGHGTAGRSAVDYGLACLELEAGDSGLRSFVSVQGSLAMFPIWRFGSDEQKAEWLPRMASGEAIGCFGLTEPGAGSNPSAMTTSARRDGGDWVIDGHKRWSTNATAAEIAVVWAQTDEGVRGFLVPRGTPGFEVRPIDGKLSLRASLSAEFTLDGVRLPDSAVLPGVRGLKGPLSCLNEARYGIVWGAVGAARACFESALEYAKTREQFGKPIGGFQITQAKLVEMLVELSKAALLALHLGRAKDAGTLRPEQVSLGKLNNVREALEIARSARTILAANGITYDYPVMRHANNLESVLTYEGTSEVHTLILGKAITGLDAFQ
jgi:glutaryl-CoA dehydrogenase